MAIIPTRWDAATLPYAYNTHISPDGLTYSSEDYYSNLAYSEFSATAGRWYWELRVDQFADNGHLRLGVARAETYDDVAAVATYAHPMSGGRPAVGDVLSVALDLDAGAMRITHNGTTWYETADIVASEGPWLAVVGNLGGTYPACVITANFGAMPFAYPVPAGYAAGFGEEHIPFLALGEPSILGTVFGAWLQVPSVLSQPEAVTVSAWLQVPSVLDQPEGMTNSAWLEVPSVLDAASVQVLAWNSISTPYASWAKVPSVLEGAVPKVLGWNDFSVVVGDAVTLFVMDLVTPSGTVRVPISSWQATLQTGSSNYVQCVIPACTMWVDAINTATEFVIYRRAVLPNGTAIEYEMARAPAESPQFDQGPQRQSCTLSGYSDAFAANENPPAIYDRALSGIRSISSGSSYRVRCAVDWLLRPGHRAFVQGAPFVVAFINYYAPSEFDCYMDVGG